MIICTNCKHEVVQQGTQLVCVECNKTIEIKEGIYCFNPEVKEDHDDYNADYLNKLYNFEKKHFWFHHRKKIILSYLKKFVPNRNVSILEIGAGTGNIAGEIISSGYKNYSVGELHVSGLEYAKTYGCSKLYQFDVYSSPFKNHFDVICMFDVLEHLTEDEKVLKTLNDMLKPGGLVILTLPAFNFLWCNIDAVSGHKKRYIREDIKSLSSKTKFSILKNKYFFSNIFPFLILRSLINKKASKKTIEDSTGLKISPFFNTLMKLFCFHEYVFFRNISTIPGGSIIAVLKKDKS